MKYELSKKIKEEAYKGAKLRELSTTVSYESAMKLRQSQKECWLKFTFFKNLAKALRKVEDNLL